MSYFENEEEVKVTAELLENFSSGPSDHYDEENYKSLEQIREERYIRQEERRLRKKRERRSKLINNLMPMTALVLLISTITYLNSLRFGLVISYNDEQVGIVENAGVVEEATSLIDSRIINKSLDSLEDEPKYRVAVVNGNSEFSNSTELSRSILAKDNVLEDEICGVFVDDTFVGATATEEEAREVLDGLLEKEKKNSAEFGEVDSVEFNSNVALEIGLYAKSSIVDKAEIKERLENNVEISYKTIVLQEQNVKIKYKTEYVVDSKKESGYEKETTKGQIGEGVATNRVTYIDGNQVDVEHIKVVATKKPVNRVITVSADNEHASEAKNSDAEKSSDSKTGTDTDSESSDSQKKTGENTADTDSESTASGSADSDSSSSSSQFIWPAPSCGSITNDFGYQGEKLHKGIDISGPAAEGQPIVASASGYVTTAVIDYGGENYGCYLIIDHGNGYQTLYAQCSDIYVAPGTYVEQGQTIAAVGSTGDSTGPHLHFEIICNGEYVNPANYLY